MAALSDLLKSEKGLFCGLLVVAGSVLTATGHMTIGEWREYTLYLAGIYVGGKALQGGAAALASGKLDSTSVARKMVDTLKSELGKNDAEAEAAVAKLPRKGDKK